MGIWCKFFISSSRLSSQFFLLNFFFFNFPFFEKTIDPLSEDSLPIPTTLYTLSLHKAPISSVRSRSFPSSSSSTYSSISSPHLITAGWDGLIGIWDLTNGVNEGTENDLEGGERKKRRKKTPKGVAINKTPVSVLSNHVGKVTRAIFDRTDERIAFSSGWDHTVRTWDLTTAQETSCKVSFSCHFSRNRNAFTDSFLSPL